MALERILGITGDDAMTIHRKNKVDWTGDLTTRLVVVSNELPRFPDSSGAIATRPLLFQFRESFVGREDKTLDAKLQAELPGILLWGIEGWKRLRRRGEFQQPQSGQALIDQLRDLSSPVGAFVRARCGTGSQDSIARSELFEAWKQWCTDHGSVQGGDGTFGKNLTAVVPGLGESHPRVNDRRVWTYTGIKLKAAVDWDRWWYRWYMFQSNSPP